jgi:hypothetical protein
MKPVPAFTLFLSFYFEENSVHITKFFIEWLCRLKMTRKTRAVGVNDCSLGSVAIANSVPVLSQRFPTLLTALIRSGSLLTWGAPHGKPLCLEHLA